MITHSIDKSQHKAAKVVGAVYLLAILPAIFAEFYVSNKLIVYDNVTQTAQNIIAHQQLFRLGIASNLCVFILDAVLITALYIVLKPINRNLALLAVFWRLIETSILVVTLLNDLDVLRILSDAEYLKAFGPDQLQALMRLSIGAHGAGYSVGLLFAGLGSALFCYLWFKSNFIPKFLAAWGIFSSLLLFLSTYAFIILPSLSKTLTVVYYGTPIFIFEVTMGFWLIIKDIKE
ncbi:MAG TPA: DUF4386 domain-containing protein [Flavitalea sp.]|nr:DUF4386 domain-containing protein [Flavitalea sp.]